MNEELKKLFEGSELSSEFVDSVSALFEKAVAEKVESEKQNIEEELTESYSKKANEYSEYVLSELEDKTNLYIEQEVLPMVEKYLDYTVKEFVKENETPIIDSIKVEAADNFLKGFAQLSESYNIKLPEGQQDIVEKLRIDNEELKKRFDATLDENTKLQEEIQLGKCAAIIESKVTDLTESQKEKFVEAAKVVSFSNDDQYKQAIDDLFESYFPSKNKELVEKKEDEIDVVSIKESIKDEWLENLFAKV